MFPNHIAVTIQVSDVSYCPGQRGSEIWPDIIHACQIALSALMGLLVTIQFIRQSTQMYQATKQLQLNCYFNILARQGMIYFLVYVHVWSTYWFPLACH